MKKFHAMMLTVAATSLAVPAWAEGYSKQGASADPQSGQMESSAAIDTNADSGAAASVQTNAMQIRDVQASLNDAGHSLPVDGVWGPQTASALRAFQEDNNLPATGSLNSETLAALDVTR